MIRFAFTSILLLSLLCISSFVLSEVYYISNTGFSAPQPDGVAFYGGSLYIALNDTNRIVKYDISSSLLSNIVGTGQEGEGGENEIAITSPVRTPTDVKIASDGTIYFTDCNNNRIRKIVAGNVSTVASTLSLSLPFGLDIHPVSGDLYISEISSRIVKLNPITGVAQALTLSGNGFNGDGILASEAKINNPLHIHVKSNGEYYFLDYGNMAIRKVDLNGNISTIVSGSFTGIGGDQYVSDVFYYGGSGQVFKYSNGTSTLIAGGGALDSNNVVATLVSLDTVYGIDVGPSGEIYISEFGTGRVRKLVSCSSNTTYSSISQSCISCFGATGLDICSGRGNCIGNNSCNCTTYGWIGSNCNVTTCNGISSELATVCSGHGTCMTIDGCSCASGYYGPDCSISTLSFNVSTSATTVSVTNIGSVGIQLISSEVIPTNYVWSCNDCLYTNPSNMISFDNSSNTLIVNGALLYSGTYTFAAYAIVDNGASYPSRISNVVTFQVIVTAVGFSTSSLEIYGLPTIVVETNASTTLNIIIPKLSLDQTLANQFLQCSNSSSICEMVVSYFGSISLTKYSAVSTLISTFSGYTVASTNFNNSITFSPSLNFKDTNTYSGTGMTLSLLLVGATNLTSSISVPILSSATPPTTSTGNSTSIILFDNLGTVSPASGRALSDTFIVTFSAWTASSQLLPLKYSIGFVDPNTSNRIRITDYTESGSTNCILPYVSQLSNSRGILTPTTLSLVVFVNDSLGNEYSSTIGSVVSVSPYEGTTTDLVTLISTYASSSLLTVFSYDKSLSSNSTSADVALEIVKNVVIDPKNPATALTALFQATTNPDSIDSRVISELTTKVNGFISALNLFYKQERAQYGFVKSKLSSVDTTSTTSIISNVLASGRGNDQSKGIADNLTNLLILGEIPTLLVDGQSGTGVEELEKILFVSSHLDISVSVFKMEKEISGTSHVMSDSDNSVTMPLSEIMKQYNGYSKESATSMITYDTNIYNSTNTSVLTSTLTDFKYYQNQQVVTLNNLAHDIVINFKITNSTLAMEKIMEYFNSTQSKWNSTEQSNTSLVMACKYWDETNLVWSSNGCYLKSLNLTSREIICSCSHTTMFTTFVEQNTTSIAPSLRDTVAAFYYGQIALGIFYFLVSIIILCLLVIFKDEQPISSRLMTPYLGMIALIVESLLVYITQRGILVRQLTSSLVQMWESGDTDANTIANIVLIFANTINLTAILSYVIQVLRFQVMKYLYDLLASSRSNEKKSDRILQVLRYLTSSTLFSSILIGFAIINVCYWVLWVVLRRTGVLDATTYTYIVSISYTTVIFLFGAIITCVAILDWAGSSIKQGLKQKRKSALKREAKFKIEKEIQKDLEKLDIFEKIYNILVGIDEPLYFRTEMIIYVISFVFLILNQVIGLVGNEYRYGNAASYKKALLFDTISFIFEVLYVFTYIFVFGGYSLILLLINKIKTYRKKKQEKQTSLNENREINEDMTLVFSNDEATEMFSTFCVKEFSSENFYLYSDLKENTDIIEGKDIEKLNPYLKYIHDNYMKDGANYQVNIPNKCRLSFMKIFNKYANEVLELLDKEAVSTDVKTTFEILVQQIFVNLGDTFSRFVFTVEFKIFKKAHELQKEVFEEANVILNEE